MRELRSSTSDSSRACATERDHKIREKRPIYIKNRPILILMEKRSIEKEKYTREMRDLRRRASPRACAAEYIKKRPPNVSKETYPYETDTSDV